MPDTAQTEIEQWMKVNFKESGYKGFDSVPIHSFLNSIVEAHKHLGSDTQSAVQIALEKSRALHGDDGAAITAIDQIFSNTEYNVDPLENLVTATETLAKYQDSPVVSSLKSCIENIEGLHTILSSANIASKSRRDRAWDAFCDSIANIVITAYKTRFAEKEFQILFDDSSFQDAALEWENSRKAWTDRQCDFEPFDKVAKIEEPLAKLAIHLHEYSRTVANDEQKRAALSEMMRRISDENLLLKTEKMRIQIENVNHAKRMQDFEETLKPISNKVAKMEKEKEEKRVAAKVRDKEIKKFDAIESIAENAIHLLEENFGKSKLDKDQKYQLTQQIRKYLSVSDASNIRANHPEIVEELANTMRDNITTSVFGNRVKIKASGLDNIKSLTLDKLEIENKLGASGQAEVSDIAKAIGKHVSRDSGAPVVQRRKLQATSITASRS